MLHSPWLHQRRMRKLRYAAACPCSPVAFAGAQLRSHRGDLKPSAAADDAQIHTACWEAGGSLSLPSY